MTSAMAGGNIPYHAKNVGNKHAILSGCPSVWAFVGHVPGNLKRPGFRSNVPTVNLRLTQW